ncbi:MAG: hypothetical protein COV47_04640 [Candidatus Diapherotrites archaeon CG11_big_fil_rev_8_21_14_0_20_37_9]|nr:MAG: hypothetical protein COV47_04640 [Candidatus Diapherotrites archaeon CG11_big_fil_rev_8_21_14_0_20_37_9]
MFSQRGQESAPFEVLIAVILMGFVIVVGLQAIQVLNKTSCEGNITKNIVDIKTGIETVVKNKSKVNISYERSSCFPENETTLEIKSRDDQIFCSSICGGSLSQCTVLIFSSPTFSDVRCLSISSATTFPEGGQCNPDLLGGNFEVVTWTDKPIEPGTYTLIKQSNLFSDTPIVCVFKKV